MKDSAKPKAKLMIQGQSNETCARSDVAFNSNSQVPLFGGDQENIKQSAGSQYKKRKKWLNWNSFAFLLGHKKAVHVEL
jgi:hypothetical protein